MEQKFFLNLPVGRYKGQFRAIELFVIACWSLPRPPSVKIMATWVKDSKSTLTRVIKKLRNAGVIPSATKNKEQNYNKEEKNSIKYYIANIASKLESPVCKISQASEERAERLKLLEKQKKIILGNN